MSLSTVLEGESKELGCTFAAITWEIIMKKRPLNPPFAVIGGRETTVKVSEDAGIGGPNQEFASGAAPGIDRFGSVVVVGIDTDGTDINSTIDCLKEAGHQPLLFPAIGSHRALHGRGAKKTKWAKTSAG